MFLYYRYGSLLTILLVVNRPALAQQAMIRFTTDLANYGNAADRVAETSATLEQRALFQRLYLDRASEGLRTLIGQYHLTAARYLHPLQRFPDFWATLRPMVGLFFSVKQQEQRDGLTGPALFP